MKKMRKHPDSGIAYEVKSYSYDDKTRLVSISLECPKDWGEGFAVEQALEALYRRYNMFYGKNWKPK